MKGSESMSSVLHGNSPQASDILNALGLPNGKVVSLTFRLRAGRPASLVVEALVDEQNGEALATELKRYVLQPIAAAAPLPPS